MLSHTETDCEKRRGVPSAPDIRGDIRVSLDEVLRPSARTIRLRRTDRKTGKSFTQSLRVKIPAGVRQEQVIRLSGKVPDGMGGHGPGPVYLRVTFAKHPDFSVQGTHVYHDVALAPWEAVLGACITIPTLDGMVSLRIPPGTAAGSDFRLRGRGLPLGDGTRGDFHAVVRIRIPSRLTPEQRELWERLAATADRPPCLTQPLSREG